MSRGEKAVFFFYAAYMLAYLPCFFLIPVQWLATHFFWYIAPFHFFGMAIGVLLLVVVFRDLYKRDFPDPNTKVTWAILMLVLTPSIIVYLWRHGFRPRPIPPNASTAGPW